MTQTDVIIIGGGVAGLMSAREFAHAGASVLVLERQTIGKESSWAGGGILSPLYPWRAADPITALSTWSQAVYPQLAEDLKQRTGVDPECLHSGVLILDCNDAPQAEAWAETNAHTLQWLCAESVADCEPNICAEACAPILMPKIDQIRNPRLLRALRQDLSLRGVKLLEHHPVDRIEIKQDRVIGVRCRQTVLSAETYVVTAGAWSGQLALDAGLHSLSILPAKGEMIVFDAPLGLLSHIVLHQGRYLIPRQDGKILAGSSVENAGFNKAATDFAQQRLQAFAYSLLPALRQCPIIKQWAGLRPGSIDGIPFIGPHPEIANLHFNCGHFRNGFVMAPASARLLADHILHRPAIVSPEPYLPPCGNNLPGQ